MVAAAVPSGGAVGVPEEKAPPLGTAAATMEASFGDLDPAGVSAKVLFHSSVILSEASGGRTFPVTVGRAESKDPGCIFGESGIKATLPSRAGRWCGR